MISNKKRVRQTKAKEHLKDLLNVESGIPPGQMKWILIYEEKMNNGKDFSKREMEIIYDIYVQVLG